LFHRCNNSALRYWIQPRNRLLKVVARTFRVTRKIC
jgi:hypothetical protein